MSRSTGTIVFVVLFIIVFVGSLALVTQGQFGKQTLAFAPIIFGSELIAFGMVYASIYFDGHEEEEAMEQEAKTHAKH